MTIIFFSDKQGKVLIFEQCCWEIYISVLKAFFFFFFFWGFCYRFDINMLFWIKFQLFPFVDDHESQVPSQVRFQINKLCAI